MTETIYAVFVVVRSGRGWAMVTRTDGRIGLPGGKIDDGESPRDAIIREALEEGWAIEGVSETHFHIDIVEENWVVWYYADTCKPLMNYKERYRGIRPITCTWHALLNSGFGNRDAGMAYMKLIDVWLK